jgi:hypothetical protein
VYQIPCEQCPLTYIGETQQPIKKRIYQHQYCIRTKNALNGIYQHTASTGHSINWNGTKILANERNFFKRKCKESLFINAVNPETQITKLMNLEKGVRVNCVWNEFVRDITRNKNSCMKREHFP